MAPRLEVTVDHGVGGEELLCLTRGLEPLHLPLSTPGRPVCVFSTIIEIAACAVFDLRQKGATRDAITAQAVGDDTLRLIPETVQQAFEEPLGGSTIAPLPHRDVQHDPVLVDSAPEVVNDAVDADENLIHVPGIARSWPPATQPFGEFGAELAAPMADNFADDHDAALGQDEFNVPQAEAEQVI